MAASKRFKGWRWDRVNDRLDIYYEGTRVGSVDSGGFNLVAGKTYEVDGTAVTASTLDAAYNGDPEIAVDSTAVLLTGTATTTDVLKITANTSASCIDLTQAGAGPDIDGTSSTWAVTKAGLGTFTHVALTSGTAPAATVVAIYNDNTGDLNLNAYTGKSIELDVADVNIITCTGSAITLTKAVTISTGGLTCGGNVGITGTLTSSDALTVSAGTTSAITSTSINLTGATTVTGNLTVTGSLTWAGTTTISETLTVDELTLSTAGVALGGTICGLWRDNGGDASLQAIASKDIKFLIAGTCEMQVGDTETIINEGSGDRNFRVESNGLAYALYIDGGLDCMVVGNNTNIADVDHRLMIGNVAKTLADNQSASMLWVSPGSAATTESGTGATTHAYIATAYFKEPLITHAGTSAITVASTVYIADAPTEGSANAALYIASGALTVVSGAVTLDGGDFLFNDAGADLNFRVESDNLAHALYVDGGNDCVVVGDNTDVSDIDARLRVGNVAKTLSAGEEASIVWIEATASTTEAASGTHDWISSLYVKEPDITHNAGGTITIGATVYIADAPDEAAANHALYVASGTTSLQGGLTVEGASVFNEASADVDFRVESNGLAYALAVNAGNDCVVIGDNTDISDVDHRLMVGNVAKTLASNQSASILYVAPTATTTEFSSGTHGYIATAYFAEPDITGAGGACTVAATVYIADAPSEATSNAALWIGSGAAMLGGTCYIGDIANATVTLGLTINQAAADDVILALKSSDVTTVLTSGVTATVETDDFATFSKFAATTGGLMVQALGENAAVTTNLLLESYGGQADTTKSTAGRGLVEIYVSQHDGSNALSDIGADGNAFVVRGRRGTADVALSILDEDGDLWIGAGLTTTTGITITGGQQILSSSGTEIGISVTNDALTVGAEGSIVAPYRATTAANFDDTAGGNVDGCFGFQNDTDGGPLLTLEARMGGAWVSVALSGIEMQGCTIGGDRTRGRLWHDNQILGNDRVDETICAKCGEKMNIGDKIALFANSERKDAEGYRNLHAIFCHAEC